jgi:hypothetical protein
MYKVVSTPQVYPTKKKLILLCIVNFSFIYFLVAFLRASEMQLRQNRPGFLFFTITYKLSFFFAFSSFAGTFGALRSQKSKV